MTGRINPQVNALRQIREFTCTQCNMRNKGYLDKCIKCGTVPPDLDAFKPAASPSQPAASQTQAATPGLANTSCPGCGAQLAPGSRFCSGCGGALDQQPPDKPAAQFCTSCGSQLKPGAQFCAKCGFRVKGQAT